MSRVLVMTYRTSHTIRVPIAWYRMTGGPEQESPEAVSRAVGEAVQRYLAGVPNVDPNSLRFRVQEDQP